VAGRAEFGAGGARASHAPDKETNRQDHLALELFPLYEANKTSLPSSFLVSASTGDNVEHLFR
jgi:hypothetical protein